MVTEGEPQSKFSGYIGVTTLGMNLPVQCRSVHDTAKQRQQVKMNELKQMCASRILSSMVAIDNSFNFTFCHQVGDQSHGLSDAGQNAL